MASKQTQPNGATDGPANGSGPTLSLRVNDVDTLLEQGVSAQQAGDVGAAMKTYARVLEIQPDNPHAAHLLGVCHHQNGDHEAAIRMIGAVVARYPSFADAQSNLGAAHFAAGNIEQAASSFERAAQLNPASAEAHSNLAAAFGDLGRIDEAIRSYLEAHRINPAVPRFVKRLGDLYLEHERFEDAAERFRQYLDAAPDDAEVHNNLGYAYERMDELGLSEASYRRAAELCSDSPEINNNLASVLSRVGKADEADIYFALALDMDPEKWQDLANLAGSLVNRREIDKALPIYRQLVDTRPGEASLHNDYGVALGIANQMDDAVAAFERAIELDPDYESAYNNYGSALLNLNRRKEAIAAFKEAIKRQPLSLQAHIYLCLALMHESQYDEAYMYARSAVLLPDYRPAQFTNPHKIFRGVCDFDAIEELGDAWENVEQNLATDYSANFLELLSLAGDDAGIRRLIALHESWARDTYRRLTQKTLPPPARYKNQKIRIGFLSSDLRSHSVSKFVRPILQNYDRDRYEIYCYTPFEDKTDRVQATFKQWVQEFRILQNRSFLEIAEAIRDDEIDILFELNGFTKDTKLRALMHKPAPVQVYWLGYPFTTGIEQIDYIMVDPNYRPADDSYLIEKPLVLPECWVCFGAFGPEPISAELPFERAGRITFGTLNNPYKYTRPMIAAWAEVMRKVPGSRFLIVRPECASMVFCSNMTKEFEKHGIERSRLYFVNNRATEFTHMTFYDEIDISLDTAPLTGGTTTCDALWMGVPVISLTGPAPHQRLSYSLLHTAGAGELCCDTIEDYVAKAVALANDEQSLREYRMGFRVAMRESVLCQEERFTEHFQAALEKLVVDHRLR